jgi:primosomal protein N' (replication factor Y) (superfamily II helicase)
VPRLEVDRPFTYLLSDADGAGTGSLVSVPFHGRTVKGWVLGPTAEVREGRLLPVRKVHSRVRFFDERGLRLLRWLSERYIAPLAAVIERSYPPRVVSEELKADEAAVDAATPARSRFAARSRGAPGGYAPPAPAAGIAHAPTPGVLPLYGGERLLEPGTTTWVRPLPDDEQAVCVDAVAACLGRGRQAVVLVPEAEPMPATARAVLEAFGERAVAFLGGEPRERYRTWLRILAGRFEVVVGTRPAVFAPLDALGLMWISREVHPGHREDRSPYYHVREVGMARARLEQAACVLASLCPSVETVAAAAAGAVRMARPPRQAERAAAPLVETVPPEAEDRSTRLTSLLKRSRSAAVVVSRRGYGVARVCRSCGESAACGVCRGPIMVEGGNPACRVCGADGVCANCGGRSFGLERGGTERLAEWARGITRVPVRVEAPGGSSPTLPGAGSVLVATAAAVKDVGPLRLDLVAIVDPDRALRRAGVHAGEQALATWMEAAAWAGPRSGNGRVLLHTRLQSHPAIQALIRWEPIQFLTAQAHARAEAGFTAGHPVFRISGSANLEEALRTAGADTILTTSVPTGTLCLVTVQPDGRTRFREEVLRLVSAGAVMRVEAEPQI